LDDFIKQFYPQETTPFDEPAYVDNVEKEEESLSWMEQKHQEEPESIEYIDNTTEKINRRTQFETIQNKPIQATEKLDFDLRKAIVYDAIMNPPYL
jgi:predicted GTPase